MDESKLCEHCLEDEAGFDGLISGEYKRLCNTCVELEGAVTLDGPSNIDISKINTRRTVKEVLMEMSGIPKPALKKKEVHLDDLRRVKKEREAEDKKFDHEIKHINDADSPGSWASRILNRRKKLEVEKDDRPSPQAMKLSEHKDDDVLDI